MYQLVVLPLVQSKRFMPSRFPCQTGGFFITSKGWEEKAPVLILFVSPGISVVKVIEIR